VQWLSRGFAVNNVIFDPNNEDIIMLQDDNTVCIINKNKVCLYFIAQLLGWPAEESRFNSQLKQSLVRDPRSIL
jgi:hypothetical protein